ncbi:ATP-binding protein [Desulfospira joergensenii]|uniref:ATP-binding protein n=1 Tax=Desulfospira joergensenii TaxID=53329 RepID=UPI0003B6F898|nr:4Fe-4S binding protein [Desulfospira joergensenii]
MKINLPKDEFLEKRLTKYDQWLEKGLISYSSKVIPVAESFTPEQWVLPTNQALKLLEGADSLAVQECECRSHYQRCNHPLEVCLILNQVADRLADRGEARHVSLDEAGAILEKANQSGLVHLSLYMPDHQIFALCSCCSCCCHDLQIVKLYGRKDLMVRSQYLAVTDHETCTLCGECVDRCVFGARILTGDELVFRGNKCLGCGLCVTTCPVGAVSMAECPE